MDILINTRLTGDLLKSVGNFVVMVLAAGFCMGSSCEDPPPPAGHGAFILAVRTVLPVTPNPTLSGGMKETLQGLTGIQATLSRVDVVHRTVADDPSTETVLTVETAENTYTLVGDLQNLASRQLGFFTIPVGFVMQIRLIYKSGTVTLRGEDYPVKVPSGPQTGVKIEPIDGVPFEVKDNERTGARIVLNPFEKLIRNKGQGFKLKPVLEAEHITTDELSDISLDELAVKFSDATSDTRIQEINDSLGVTVLGRWKPKNYYALKLPASLSMRDAIEQYLSFSEVETVVPDFLLELGVTWPSDPVWDPALQDKVKQFKQVQFDDAWDIGTGNYSPIVAVVDTGVDLDHPDLINNIFINTAEIPNNVFTAQDFKDANGDNKKDWKDIDFNGDNNGILSFSDLNSPANLAISSICPVANTPPAAECNPRDLIDGTGNASYGWQDGVDNDDLDGDPTSYIDDIIGWDFEQQDNLPLPRKVTPASGENHGTELAGIIGAVGDNALGLAGTNWSVRILPIKGAGRVTPSRLDPHEGLDYFKASKNWSIIAFKYAQSLGSDVINASFGSALEPRGPGSDQGIRAAAWDVEPDKYDDFVAELKDEFDKIDLNTLLVTISHNAAFTFDLAGQRVNDVDLWPGSFKTDNVVVVGGVEDNDDIVATYGVGSEVVDIAAPAKGFWVVKNGGGATDPITNTCVLAPGDCNGTSYAAPLVSGAAALVLSHDSGLRGNPCKLADRILRNAQDFDKLKIYVGGGRRLDADKAMRNVVGESNPVRSCP